MKKSSLLGAVCAGVVTIASLPVNAVSITSISGEVSANAFAGSNVQSGSITRPPVTDTLWPENRSAFAYEADLGSCDPFDPGCFPSESSAYSEASQSSYVASNGLFFSASGESNANAFSSDFLIPAEANAASNIEVEFMLESAYNYNLTGSASGFGAFGSGEVWFDGMVYGSSGGGPFDVSGALVPGSYTLYGTATAEADIFIVSNNDFSFELSLTPVPVPAAVWLFASGLLGLVGIARRKKA